MEKRKVYLDIIRIIAAYLVIFTHTCELGSGLYILGDYGPKRTLLYTLISAASRICVPLFFMVSGALMLAKEETYQQLFRNRILKYMITLIGISYFYFVFYNQSDWHNIYQFFQQTYSGTLRFYLWFLYAYIGYLLCLPFLRKMVKNLDETDFKYLFLIGILFKGGLDVFGALTGFGNIGITCVMVTDAVFYPLMGYYLENVDKREKNFNRIVIGAGVCLICVLGEAFITIWERGTSGNWTENYMSAFNVIPVLYTFFMTKKLGEYIQSKTLLCKIINWIGSCTFGIYLVGMWLQGKMTPVYFFVFGYMRNFPMISSFIYVFAVLVVGILLISVLKLIPGLKKII